MKRWIYILLLLLPLVSAAQGDRELTPCTGYLASVDEATQKIVLSWHPSTDSAVAGYYVCTGTPCLDERTVHGSQDTTFVYDAHKATEPHTYCVWVFDSSGYVSSMTPPFGNMVLSASVPRCETAVDVSWTPYVGMPSGIPRYTLWVKLEPFDTDYDSYYYTSDPASLFRQIDFPESVTRIWLKVEAEGMGGYHSWSNVVMVERPTVDSADFIKISGLEYDSIATCVRIGCLLDSDFDADHYTVQRSIDGSPWRDHGTFRTRQAAYTYVDDDINPFDSLHCYRLVVLDACGMNPKDSPSECVVVPTPPTPAIVFPNAIVAGSDDNGTFRPKVQGLMGNLYELTVYNRQGLRVFYTADQDEGWTPSPDLPQGVYAYHLRCRFNTGDVKNYTGTVTLIK